MGIPVRLDLEKTGTISESVSEIGPEAIVHAAAYTDVDGCETNRNLAWRVNAESTRLLARVGARENAHLTYASTDYVFDGARGLYREVDPPNPINWYGKTKREGELHVAKAGGDYCIARSSVIFGWGPEGRDNFATWLITGLMEGRELRIAADQFISPTLNEDLARMLLEIAERRVNGVLHTAGANRVNRREFVLRLADVFDLDTSCVNWTTMDQLPWKARRPIDSSLDVSRAASLLNRGPLGVDDALVRMWQTRTRHDTNS
jgi:dTDP-4-dehydrorhamnose reductase